MISMAIISFLYLSSTEFHSLSWVQVLVLSCFVRYKFNARAVFHFESDWTRWILRITIMVVDLRCAIFLIPLLSAGPKSVSVLNFMCLFVLRTWYLASRREHSIMASSTVFVIITIAKLFHAWSTQNAVLTL